MGSDVIVEVLVVGKGCDDSALLAAVEEVPKLDTGAVVGAFDATVESGSSRRQDKRGDIEGLAGWPELGPKPGAAVNLDGVQEQVLGGNSRLPEREWRWVPNQGPDAVLFGV